MNKNIAIVIAILLAGVFGGIAGKLVGGNQSVSHKLGSADFVTNLNGLELSQGLMVTGSSTLVFNLKNGATGTNIMQRNQGLCYIYPYATTIAATSTANVDCQATSNASGGGGAGALAALTGVQANDIVVASLSTTTSGTTWGNGITLAGASASTTAGYITLHLINNTGGTFTWPTSGAASGTAYYISGR